MGKGPAKSQQGTGAAVANHAGFHQRKSPPAQRRCKKGADNDQAVGRSRGGLTSKVHAAVDERGRPLKLVLLVLSGGNRNDICLAPRLLEGLALANRFVLADKGYDSAALVRQIEAGQGARLSPRGQRVVINLSMYINYIYIFTGIRI